METGFLDRTLPVAGRAKRYVLFKPADLNPVEPAPAILFLHGRGESGTDGIYPLYHGLAHAIVRSRSSWPFVCVFPQKPEEDSEWFDEKPMLDAILEAVDAEVKIDPHRRYLTGLSQGGRGTMRLAKKLKWQFAAIAPVCGWADPEVAAQELKGIPMWLFHGEKDPVIPPSSSKDVYDAVRKAGGEPKLTLYPDLFHNCWDRAYKEEPLAKWLLSHSL